GEGGIGTYGTVTRTTVFETAPSQTKIGGRINSRLQVHGTRLSRYGPLPEGAPLAANQDGCGSWIWTYFRIRSYRRRVRTRREVSSLPPAPIDTFKRVRSSSRSPM